MGSFIEETTLHFEDDTFKKLRTDADQVLQKLLANMAEKGSLEGKMTITIDVSFTEETVQNRDPNIEGDMRIVHTPKFQHKVGSVLQIKNEQKGDMNCDGMSRKMMRPMEVRRTVRRTRKICQMNLGMTTDLSLIHI